MDKVVALRLHFCVPEFLAGQSTGDRKCAAHLHSQIAAAASRNPVEPGGSFLRRSDPLSAKFKSPFFKQVAWRNAGHQDCEASRDGWAVSAGDGRAAHIPERILMRNDSPPTSAELMGYSNRLDADTLDSSVLAVLEERAADERAASDSRSSFEAISSPADFNSHDRQNASPAKEDTGQWSFQAEDFEWRDRRDPITNFRCFGEALSTSYDRIWSLREKHGVWFAADQERHPKPLWSLDDPDYDEDLKAVKSSGPEPVQTEMPGPSKQAGTGDVWLLDSSFLVALLDSHDLYSPLCLHAVDLMGNAKKVVAPECISEATQLIRSRIGGLRGVELELFMYRCIEEGTFEVVYPETIRGLNRFIRLKDELMDSGLGPTAAAIIALSKQLSIRNVATLDRKRLEAAGDRSSASINLLPA